MKLCIPKLGQSFAITADWVMHIDMASYVNSQISCILGYNYINNPAPNTFDFTFAADTVFKVMKVWMQKSTTRQLMKLHVVRSPDKRLVPPSKGGTCLGGLVVMVNIDNMNEMEVEFI